MAPARANDLPTGADIIQAGLDEAARELTKVPGLRRLTPEQRRARAEFVFGNMLFVIIHELAHALVSEMDLIVLGREEDAADAYATLGSLKCGTELGRRVLIEAAKGWFMTAQRDRQAGEVAHYYDRHGLDEQRAYQIVCLMVGSNPTRFKDLADETELPEDRRRSCGWDYDTASRSWERALTQHHRPVDQPKSQIQIIYGEGKGKLALHQRIFSGTRFLETIVDQVANMYSWPAPIVMEMKTCGEPNARWTIPTRRLHVCYELAQEFAELYREYGGRTLAGISMPPKPQLTSARARPQTAGAWKRRPATTTRAFRGSRR